MRRILLIGLLLGASPGGASGEEPGSPYAGMQQREIKALSAETIAAYLAGEGMGLAMAAELNSYPGPKHVLELADELELDDAQLAATRRIWHSMHEAALRLGAEYVTGERRLDTLFADRTVDRETLRSAVAELARIRGELRYAHLNAHLDTRSILSTAQLARYDELRGYRHADPSHHGHSTGHHR